MEEQVSSIQTTRDKVHNLEAQLDQLRTLKRTLIKMKIITTQLKFDIAKAEIENSTETEGTAKKWKDILNNLRKDTSNL